MPRLTSQDYLAQRRLLIKEWYEHDAIAFGDIPLQAQHDLHDFYAPTEPMSDADALKHRAAMAKAFPLSFAEGRPCPASLEAGTRAPRAASRRYTSSITEREANREDAWRPYRSNRTSLS